MIRIDAESGVLSVAAIATSRRARRPPVDVDAQFGMGRELFAAFRERATGAEQGASLFGPRET